MTNRIAVYAAVAVAAFGVTATSVARADGPDLIAVRQAAFDMNAGSFGLIRATVAAKGDVKPLGDVAGGIAKWAALIPVMFPKGTETGDNTKALPEIWSDPAGFKKAAADFGASATKLAELAKAGDLEGVTAETKVLGSACGACHKVYRAK
jgi:cytochrome c556